MHEYFVTCAKGLEALLFEELNRIGCDNVKQTQSGCYVSGELKHAYLICLHSRIAGRVLLRLGQADVSDAASITRVIADYAWEQHMLPSHDFSIDFSGTSGNIRHTQFGAQTVKDGIVDRIREQTGQRPNVNRQQPDIRVNARLHKGILHWYLDLSGDSLHKRGYRQQQGAAPLRETLAAAVIARSQFDASTMLPVMDAFCGSGTLLIEAAMIATHCAPGLHREQWGFRYWLGHDEALWQQLRQQARERFIKGKQSYRGRFYGFDNDVRMLAAARANTERAELSAFCQWQQADATELTPVAEQGLLISNPPYGERLGEEVESLLLYRRFGRQLRAHFTGWQVALLCGDEQLLKRLKLRSDKKYKFFNGALEVLLALYDLTKEQPEFNETQSSDIANRLKKNYQKLAKWADKEGLDAWRLYDADLPDYNAAIDVYNDYLVVQEYAAPSTIPEQVARERLWQLLETLSQALPFADDHIILKVRQRQAGRQQYQKRAEQGVIEQVREYGALFEVNLTDYLDTGLFLDHRPVRRLIAEKSAGLNVLNLFAYTCSASVHAAIGGAAEVTSVDLSKTYLQWGQRNFQLNKLYGDQYQFIQADCLAWLADQPAASYDLIFIDPPTFSNSKRMADTLDIQRDHVAMLVAAARLLADDGVILFSNNKRRFKIDESALAEHGLVAIDRTKASIAADFERNKGIHHLFVIMRNEQLSESS
ncbi:bifunctional 23S rRNA (guanine(2069)-N(7))-methyltransferase RlmK/23S rRNA (guanine(2445)-N(2))-methyltransferase RlmL [Idiomarina xiamenensis]|uniref:Ribosomal RNA large subunit methyltransferase K/L n=1 Tax=Idiomarina xiamenensis 10-D-4 TaxID=740709 RepID=K2LB37_9GAMM|nr:bifunctional 23S rRNA (guanine(2069)-N(7))-methyltransferase RlmK/23S rRNA (guanine(2445)-N(2))-methyltransferase RlmL [Idiomarina xiamenensis]EKE87025.1 23S rRNA m(2)G2445 methyltransferase [Idiomarina xiamenensis 10-D-4]